MPLVLHDWFAYDYTTEKLSRNGDSAPNIGKLADGTEEKFAWTEAIRPFYREKLATHGMLFESAKAAWLHILQKKMHCLGIPPHEVQVGFMKLRSSSTVSVGSLEIDSHKEFEVFKKSWKTKMKP